MYNIDPNLFNTSKNNTDELSQVLMDAMPMCANCWNRNLENISCNLEAVKLFDLSCKQEYLDRFAELSPKYQPNGSLSSELSKAHIDAAFREGYCQFEWMHQKLNGEPIPAEITLVRTKYNGEDIVAGYTRDLRDWNRTLSIMREADERTQIMLDATPLCSNFWDKDGNNIDCNQAAANLFDLSSKHEYLQRFAELSPEYQPDGRRSSELAAKYVAEAFKTGYKKFEWMHQKLNGEQIPAEITLVRVKRDDGYIVAGYTQDLRELKATADKMQEADERTQIMLDATPLCANFWDKNYNNIDCNQEAVNLFELSSKREYLERFHELSPEYQPDGQPSSDKANEKIRIAFRDGYCKFEWMHQKLNGEPIPSEITLVRVKHRDGDVVVGYTRDLRELKATLAKIREADERTQLMLDATPLCCNLWDQNFNNIDCNQEAVNLFGLSSKQEYLKRFFELSPEFQPDGELSSEKAKQYIETAFQTGYCRFEWMHQKLSGEPIPAEITLVRVLYKNGYIVAGYTRDMRELKATLGKMEQTQEELRQARDKAEESAMAKSNFLANMSHEIRTPMNAIIGMTNIAKDSRDPERIQYCLEKIDASANHLLGVINDILDMSKIESGKFTLSPKELSIDELLQQVISVINYKVEEKQQRLIVNQGNTVPESIIADQQRLIQVITNLLSNAVKFTPEKGMIQLDVSCLCESDKDCILKISVKDTGIGISPYHQMKLFQSFEQADSSISRRFGGTGLGLAISKNIVETMGGTIWVESEVGKGSCFSFLIKPLKGKREETNGQSRPVNWADFHMLAVGPVPEVLANLQDNASKLGISCFCSTQISNLDTLFTPLKEDERLYNMLFIDWSLPPEDIAALIEQAAKSLPDIIIVAMIPSVEQSQFISKANQFGIHRFLVQPILHSALIKCLNECLSIESPAQEEFPVNQNASIFSGKHILLAEDIAINREILITLLEDTGVRIDCAEDGKDAVHKFAAEYERYDMIFMDIHMPGLDGYQATRSIRAMNNSKAGSIPIIAMTANVFQEDIRKCLEAGMNDHIGKPLDIDIVIEKMKHYIL